MLIHNIRAFVKNVFQESLVFRQDVRYGSIMSPKIRMFVHGCTFSW